jgi:glycosyltransferase involved in cell wall biosynthesis
VKEDLSRGISKPTLHLFMRKRRPHEQSMERLFGAISGELRHTYHVKIFVSPFHSRGVLRRIALILWVYLKRGKLNHITGDINFAGLLLPRKQTLVTIHDAAPLKRLSGWRRTAFSFLWITLPIWRAGYVTTGSEASLRELLPHTSVGKRIRVIPDCALLPLQPKPKVVGSRPRILQIGTREHKNLERVVVAITGIPCSLLIVGPLSSKQLALLDKHGIQYSNLVDIDEDTLLNAYLSSDLVTFLSTYEGFGLPILEAQAIGRAVLASRLEPMLSVAGPGAATADPFDVGEIRQALVRLMSDDDWRQGVIEAGLRNVSNYTPARIAAAYASIYEEILRVGSTSSPKRFR